MFLLPKDVNTNARVDSVKRRKNVTAKKCDRVPSSYAPNITSFFPELHVIHNLPVLKSLLRKER